MALRPGTCQSGRSSCARATTALRGGALGASLAGSIVVPVRSRPIRPDMDGTGVMISACPP